jgi:hypothetical protein
VAERHLGDGLSQRYVIFGVGEARGLRHRSAGMLSAEPVSVGLPGAEFAAIIARKERCELELCELKMNCEIIEVSHVQDARVYPCGRDAIGECSDCGTRICDEHRENCGHCKQQFCLTCLSFHERAIITKKPGSSVSEQYSRKQA